MPTPMPTRRWRFAAVGLAAAALTVAPMTMSAAMASTGTNTVQTSTSWAGYQASGSSPASVTASWTVPTPTCGSASTSANIYAGIGGTPIAGVIVSCDYGIEQWQPWIYLGMPEPSSNTVAAGDSMTVTATYLGLDASSGYDFYEYDFVLTDHTQNWTESSDGLETSPSLGDSVQVGVAPENIKCEGLDFCFNFWQGQTLTDFGTVNFTGATFNGEAIGDAPTDQTDLLSGTATAVATSGLDSSGEDFSIAYES
jgi:hypothetical protein